MWQLSLPWFEFVLRGAAVYLFIFLLLRLTGRRQVGQLTTFDLVLLLLLSNAVQNSMNGGDNTVTAGFILVATLAGINLLLAWFTARSKKFEGIIEGRPLVLIHNGQLYEDVVRGQNLSRQEIDTALRTLGISSVADVHYAILEPNGAISAKPMTPHGSAGPSGQNVKAQP